MVRVARGLGAVLVATALSVFQAEDKNTIPTVPLRLDEFVVEERVPKLETMMTRRTEIRVSKRELSESDLATVDGLEKY